MAGRLIVVGGGPAGMMAAITAARSGCKVRLLEKNDRVGRKLAITGKGRCNVTNDCTPEEVLRQIPRNAKFLYSAMNAFPPEKTMAFFTEAQCPLKTERGRRVFPESDQAASVVEALKKELRRAGVRVEKAEVTGLLVRDGVCCGVETGGRERKADAVILATGGCSYPRTGSRGDGYRLAEQAGLTVVPPQPSLIPLETAESDAAEMQGLSLRNVTLTVTQGKKTVFTELGEMLFTHFGISGPLVLSASCRMEPQKLDSYLMNIDREE